MTPLKVAIRFARNTTALAAPTFETENQDVLNAVKVDPAGIAFIGLGFLTDNPTLISGLWIGTGNPASNFVEPTKAHILDLSYKYDGFATTTPTPAYRWLWQSTNGIPTKGSAGAVKTDFVNYCHMNPQFSDQSGYVRMLWSDFTGATAPVFASQDSTNTAGQTHPNLPDNAVDASDVTYFVLAYNHQFDASATINPLCDYNADHTINAVDVTQFILGYNGYVGAPGGTAFGPATGITG